MKLPDCANCVNGSGCANVLEVAPHQKEKDAALAEAERTIGSKESGASERTAAEQLADKLRSAPVFRDCLILKGS